MLYHVFLYISCYIAETLIPFTDSAESGAAESWSWSRGPIGVVRRIITSFHALPMAAVSLRPGLKLEMFENLYLHPTRIRWQCLNCCWLHGHSLDIVVYYVEAVSALQYCKFNLFLKREGYSHKSRDNVHLSFNTFLQNLFCIKRFWQKSRLFCQLFGQLSSENREQRWRGDCPSHI